MDYQDHIINGGYLKAQRLSSLIFHFIFLFYNSFPFNLAIGTYQHALSWTPVWF